VFFVTAEDRPVLLDLHAMFKVFRCNITEYASIITKSTLYLKLTCNHSRTNLSRHFYFNRVCRLWNALPPIDLSFSSGMLKISCTKNL